MGVWLAEVAAGSPAPRVGASHLEARWVSLADLAALPWIVADLPIVEAVSPAALADSPAVRSGVQETGVRESSDRCCCVNMRFVPHALPFDDT